MPALSQRPEARWALWSGIVGGLAATAVQVDAILSSTHPSAAGAFFLVPLITIAAGAAAGIWGLALGHVVARLRREVHEPWTVFAAALAAAVALPLALFL